MKSTSGFILSLIGGVLNILFGFALCIFGAILILVIKGVDIAGNFSNMLDFSTILVILIFFFALWYFVAGILLIIFSIKINNDTEAKKGGILCLIFGLLSLNIFSVIGGILGISAGRKIESQNQMNLQIPQIISR